MTNKHIKFYAGVDVDVALAVVKVYMQEYAWREPWSKPGRTSVVVSVPSDLMVYQTETTIVVRPAKCLVPRTEIRISERGDMNRIDSVIIGRDSDVINHAFPFYLPVATRVIDVTANRRKMWKRVRPEILSLVKFYDIDPAVDPDHVCSWDNLPDEDGSVDAIIYDPPHLPLAAASPKSLERWKTEYGLARSVVGDNISSMHGSFLTEAKRVLRKDGMVFAKIKDYVHNHRYQWNMADFIKQAEASGLTPCDLIIKRDPAAGNLKSGRWRKSHHARNVHCYWVILRNGRCEPSTRIAG